MKFNQESDVVQIRQNDVHLVMFEQNYMPDKCLHSLLYCTSHGGM